MAASIRTRDTERDRVACSRWVAVALLLVATLLPASWVATASPATAGTTTTAIPLTTMRAMVVDPASGRVFVSGDSAVAIFAPDGSLTTTLTGIAGAAGMDFDGAGNLWVAASTGSALAKVDLASLAVTTLAQPSAVGFSVAFVDGGVWYLSGSALKRFDVGTATAATRATTLPTQVAGTDRLLSLPGAHRLLAYDFSLGTSLFSIDITATPAPVAWGPSMEGGGVFQVAATGDGTNLVTSKGNQFESVAGGPTGLRYPMPSSQGAVATSAAGGGLVAFASRTSRKLSVAPLGTPVVAQSFDLAADPEIALAGVSPTGGYAYAGLSNRTLVTASLGSSLSAASPTTTVSGVPTTVTVTGEGLGRITAATLGGVAATTSVDSTTQVRVAVPTDAPTGAQPLVLTTPFGSVSTTVTVTPSTPAVLQGTIRSGSTPQAGVALQLSGGGLSSPVSGTSSGSGTYSFGGLAYGKDYTLVAAPLAGPEATQTAITLTPNVTTTLDLNLASPPARTAVERSADLPTGTVRRMATDPATGRTFVSVGDEVAVFAPDGRLLRRIPDQWTANGLAVEGASVYVNLTSAGRISRIDTSTLLVTGSYATDRITNGELVVAAGKLVYTGTGTNGGFVMRDLGTGALSTAHGASGNVGIDDIDGSPNLFLTWPTNGSQVLSLTDASTGEEVAYTGGGGHGQAVGSQALGALHHKGSAHHNSSCCTRSGNPNPTTE